MSTSLDLILWNRLDGAEEVLNSEIGPDGILVGSAHAFESAQFGNGYVRTARGSHIEFPQEIFYNLNERGTVELWVNPKVPYPVPYRYGIFGLIGHPYGEWWEPENLVPPYPANIGLSWGDGVTGGNDVIASVQFEEDFQALTPGVSDKFVATVGVPFHVAMTWDVDGIGDSNDTVRVYRDGNLISATQDLWDPQGNYLDQNNIWLGYSPDGEGFNKFIVDNLKIWDDVKTDFSDRFDPNAGAYQIIEGDDQNNRLLGNAGLNQILGLGGNDTIYGYQNDDYLIGGLGNDFLYGGEDNDRLYGGQGNDYLSGQGGNDTLFGEEGNDSLWGGTGTDTLWGGDGHDNLSGDGGNDVLYGEGGNDTLSGVDGYDNLSGGDGNDIISGGGNDDTISGDAGQDTISGDGGNDNISGGNDDDNLSGGVGVDTISGGNGNDALYGDAAKDSLIGDAGNDTLYGEEGNDSLIGGADADQFFFGIGVVFNRATLGVDMITDFQKSEQDKIALRKSDFSALTSLQGEGFSVATEFAQVTTDNLAAIGAAIIAYNINNGKLFYNPNGSEPGFASTSTEGGYFANLVGTPSLIGSDFVIV